MRAVVFDKKLKLAKLDMPSPGRGEALVRVSLAGICNTDMEIVKGYMGFRGIIGHEFVGVVERCSDKSLIGARVTGEINAGCGKCRWCKDGMERHCPNRTVVGIYGRPGAFADYVVLPAKNLHKIPKALPNVRAVFTEPVAACFEILDQVKISREQEVAIIGDGKLGALAAQVIATKNPRLTVFGKHDDKLSRIKRNCRLTTRKTSAARPGTFDVVVECSSSPSGLELAAGILRPRGTLMLKSTFHEKPCVDTSSWVVNELTIVGSRCGRFEPALRALSAGTVNPEPLVDRVFPASNAVKAFEYASQPGVFKVLIDFSE